jgi:uncharacterized phage protein (TIGR02220 family)
MRIRSIKPEFWESECIGRVTRDARLLLVGLFTCCDDTGRTRASARLLASRIFPYDDDALRKLPTWLSELEREKCIRLYVVEGETYLDVPQWALWQKIDRPTPSKLPGFDEAREGSRGLARAREDSRGLARVLAAPPPHEESIARAREGSHSPPTPGETTREASRNVALDQGSGIRDQGSGNGKGSAEGALPPAPPPEEGRDVAVAILDHLNREAGREFADVDANLKLIRSRLDEVSGDEAGVRLMVSRMVQKWGSDEKMVEYLRPATLFGKSKFRGYYDDRNQPVNRNVLNAIVSPARGAAAVSGPELPANAREHMDLLSSPELIGLGPTEHRAKLAELTARRSAQPAVG